MLSGVQKKNGLFLGRFGLQSYEALLSFIPNS